MNCKCRICNHYINRTIKHECNVHKTITVFGVLTAPIKEYCTDFEPLQKQEKEVTIEEVRKRGLHGRRSSKKPLFV